MMNSRSTSIEATKAAPTYAISAEDSKRIEVWRLWMALLVLFAHAYNVAVMVDGGSAQMVQPAWLKFFQHITCTIIARCSTTSFALISAVLLYRKPFSWRTNTVRKFKQLIVPLFLLTSFWVVVYAVGPHLPGLRSLVSSATLRMSDWTPSYWFGVYLGWTEKHAIPSLLYPLWFLRDLMLMHLFAPVIKWVIDRIPRLFLCVLAVLLVMKTNSSFHYYTIHQVFIFFCLGYYVVKYDLHLSDLDRVPWLAMAALYILVIAGAYMARAYYRPISAVRGIPNLVGSLFFARCCTRIPEGKWLKRIMWLSQYNIAIYMFQERMYAFFKKLVHALIPASVAQSLVQYWALPVVVGTLCVLIARFLRRYQPRLYSIITGTRPK